jgi:hypothetical protein
VLQSFEMVGQAAHHRVGAERNGKGDAAEEDDQPNTGFAAAATAGRRSSGCPTA